MNNSVGSRQMSFAVSNRKLYSALNDPTWPSNLARLISEREILENGLANCVTYLIALRKKHAKNERRLNIVPGLPRKKRKSMQHCNRELEREIKNREREELAFLNNLQACKANIYVAETLSCTWTDLSQNLPDYSSSSATLPVAAASQAPYSCWNDWNDWNEDTSISPFQRESSATFFADEIAPDDCSNAKSLNRATGTSIKRPPPLFQHVEDFDIGLPVPPNTAQSQFQFSTLSPYAQVFEPNKIFIHDDVDIRQKFDRLSVSPFSWYQNSRRAQRSVTDPTADQASRWLSLRSRSECTDIGSDTWCSTTPRRPNKSAASGDARRRANSL